MVVPGPGTLPCPVYYSCSWARATCPRYTTWARATLPRYTTWARATLPSVLLLPGPGLPCPSVLLLPGPGLPCPSNTAPVWARATLSYYCSCLGPGYPALHLLLLPGPGYPVLHQSCSRDQAILPRVVILARFQASRSFPEWSFWPDSRLPKEEVPRPTRRRADHGSARHRPLGYPACHRALLLDHPRA